MNNKEFIKHILAQGAIYTEHEYEWATDILWEEFDLMTPGSAIDKLCTIVKAYEAEMNIGTH